LQFTVCARDICHAHPNAFSPGSDDAYAGSNSHTQPKPNTHAKSNTRAKPDA
jgi:hypothetical protein